MKINVVYATRTQHSKKIAEAIGQEFAVKAQDVQAYLEPQTADMQFIVGGIYGGKEHPALLAYAEKLVPATAGKVVLVTSSLFKKQRQQKEFRRIMEEKGIEIAAEIGTDGAFLFFKASHPTEEDIQAVAQAAKEAVEK